MLNIKELFTKMLTVESVTPTFTTDVTSPTGSVYEANAKIVGRVCHLSLGVKNTSATSAGGNVYHGRISEEVRPAQLANGVGYYASSCGVVQILSDGEIVVRIIGSSLAANSTIYCSLCYPI